MPLASPRLLKRKTQRATPGFTKGTPKPTFILRFNSPMANEPGWKELFPQVFAMRDLRRSRYIGLAKTHLQHVATLLGYEFKSLERLVATSHIAATRTSAFAALAAN